MAEGSEPTGSEADDAEPIEPEPSDAQATQASQASVAKARAQHHPPPPPSLRPKSAADDHHGPGTRFGVRPNPRVARDLMSKKLFTIEPDTKLKNLEQQMESFRFRHLPVVEGEKLLGLITLSDLLHASSSFLSETAKERDAIIHQQPASRIMQKELITVGPDEPLTEVAILMWETRVGCVLVVENEDTLLGIITEGDFIRLAHHLLTNERPPDSPSRA